MDEGDSNFMQLPYMTREMLKKWQKKSKMSRMKFKEYVRLPKEQLGCSEFFPPEEAKAIEGAVENFPKLALEVKCYVKGSDKIYQGDLLTVEVNVTRKYGAKEVLPTDLPTAIHSNHYPYPKQEILWLIVASQEQRRIFNFAKLHRPFSTMRKEYPIFLEKVRHECLYIFIGWEAGVHGLYEAGLLPRTGCEMRLQH